MIYNPLISDNQFDETFVAQENHYYQKIKRYDRQQISNFIFELIEIYVREQPYRHLATGQVEYIADITPENLYHTYQSMLQMTIVQYMW